MKHFLYALVGIAVAGGTATADPIEPAPMELVRTIPIDGDSGGEFDHFLVDPAGDRLFAADEGHQVVDVIDLRTNKMIRALGKGVIHTPHSLLYRKDIDRLFVIDGDLKIGAVRIFDTKTYQLVKSIDLPPLADWSGFDHDTNYLYVSGLGAVLKKPDSTVTIIDTTNGEQVGQYLMPDPVITAFALEPSGPNIYTGLRTKNLMAIVDRKTMKVINTWPVTLGTGLGSEALDSANHRLFVNCRSGQTIVFNTQTGEEVVAIPINTFSDDIFWDAAAKRLYITAKGAAKDGHATVQVFQQLDPDHYKPLGEVNTAPEARTGIYAPDRKLFYVGAPHSKGLDEQILVYHVH